MKLKVTREEQEIELSIETDYCGTHFAAARVDQFNEETLQAIAWYVETRVDSEPMRMEGETFKSLEAATNYAKGCLFRLIDLRCEDLREAQGHVSNLKMSEIFGQYRIY